MNASRALLLLFTAAMAVSGAAWAGQIPPDEQAALARFDVGLAAYAELHRRLEGPVPVLEVSGDLAAVHAAMAAIARRIRSARPDARQGDLFTERVARILRARIAGAMPQSDLAVLLAEQDEDAPAVPPRLRVHAPWPAEAPFSYVPPPVLGVLPPLPPELQYRIIGRTLVLWDHHANLIVDYLPHAFPA